ncbi:hypothetical protein CEXT_85951 [Caerostris extrusa]|uniref:Uncharacterized protein n=1 Tax=Caerostris extrusa TaxID=172846 RepID=A0AAV4Y588_CAEEX|nr:hypothetical protein CEXT_85951 [Caerostris extrusa]
MLESASTADCCIVTVLEIGWGRGYDRRHVISISLRLSDCLGGMSSFLDTQMGEFTPEIYLGLQCSYTIANKRVGHVGIYIHEFYTSLWTEKNKI